MSGRSLTDHAGSQSIDAVRSIVAAEIVGKAIDGVRRVLFGRDVFLSYSHRDGRTYADALVKALEATGPRGRLSCVWDQRTAILDASLPDEVLRPLRWASMLVVVGSPEAGASDNVAREIEIFQKLRRPIVIIVCSSGPDLNLTLQAFADKLRRNGATLVEEAVGVLSRGPTEKAIVAIWDAADFTRHNRRLMLSAVAGITLLAGVASFTSWRMRVDASKLSAAEEGGSLPGVTVLERATVVDLAGWKPTSDQDLAQRRRVSKAISRNRFLLFRTRSTLHTFVHVMGTSSGIQPEFRNLSRFHAEVVPRRDDETTKAPREWRINFDISSVPVQHEITIEFEVVFWNAFQQPEQWWSGFRTLHQTRQAWYILKFPSARRPMADTLDFVTKGETQQEEVLDETPRAAIEQDLNGDVVSVEWFVTRPQGDRSYRLKWEWDE